jgi:hypothetical protein
MDVAATGRKTGKKQSCHSVISIAMKAYVQTLAFHEIINSHFSIFSAH